MKLLERRFNYNISNITENDTGYVEIEVSNDDIKYWLSIKYSPSQIVKLAQTLDPDIPENGLDESYKLLVEDYDEIEELDEYIEECIYSDFYYEELAMDEVEYDKQLKDEEDSLAMDLRMRQAGK